MQNRDLLHYLKKRFLGGIVFALGMGTVGLIAATVSGTMHTFTADEVVSAAKINENFTSLKTAIEAIHPQYVTSEVATGKVWIDGKTIYSKVVNIGTLPNATNSTTAHNISNLAVLINARGFASNGTHTIMLPHVDKDPGTSSNVQINVNLVDIDISTSLNWTAYSGFLILEYTKN